MLKVDVKIIAPPKPVHCTPSQIWKITIAHEFFTQVSFLKTLPGCFRQLSSAQKLKAVLMSNCEMCQVTWLDSFVQVRHGIQIWMVSINLITCNVQYLRITHKSQRLGNLHVLNLLILINKSNAMVSFLRSNHASPPAVRSRGQAG